MRSKVTALSYLHSGVDDNAVPCTAESDFSIKNSVSDHVILVSCKIKIK
jgi:hypothetical protein